jgi:Leucine-rich repeat (LRR) protein
MSLLIICANVTVLISKANKEKEVALEHKKIKEDADAAGHYDIDGTARRLIRDGLNRSDSDGKFSLKFENDDSVMDELAKYPARAYSIDLTNSSVKGPGLAFLIRYPVRFLSLNDSNLTDRGLLEVKHLKKLEELQIDNSSITRDGLKELKNLPKLRRLSARSDRIDDAALNNIKDIASLEYLQCGRNETLTAAGYGHLKTMKNLNTLDVMENHIDVNSAQEISQLPHIAWINLDSTDVDDAGLKALSKMSKLKHLDLPNCKKVSRTGLNYLSRLPNLQHIKLEEDRQLKDEDFESIKKCPALKFLDIRSSNAGDKTMETVGDSKIESLYIQNTKITDKGFLSILKDKHLKNVEIEHTQFSQQARDQFNAQRPGVLKYFDIDRSPF